MVQVKLYTTTGCHLCEEAEAMLEFLHTQGKCSWKAVEISDSDQMIEEYGLKIPVIGKMDGEEIGWPFSFEELSAWINR